MSDKDDDHKLAVERREEAEDYARENRDEQRNDLEFAAGKHWPAEIERQRLLDNRPCLTLPRVLQYVHQVTGDIRQSPPAIMVVPVDDGADKRTAKVMSSAIRHIERRSDAQYAYINAAEGAAMCGEGHFRLVTEYEDDETANQTLCIKPVRDHLSVLWDPFAQDRTKADARYCFVYERIPLADFKAQYPDAQTDGFDTTTNATRNMNEGWWDGEYVTVAEYWWVETKKVRKAFFKDGRTINDIDEELDDDAREQATKDAKRVRTIETKRIFSRLMNGSEFLTAPTEWPGKRIPIFTAVGEEIAIDGRTVRFGLVRPVKDAQRSYNYMRSAGVEAIALAPKAPLTGTVDMVKGLEHIYAKAISSNVDFLPFNPDPKMPGAYPKRVEPPNPAIGIAQEALAAIQDMDAATGIYPASLGARSNETSGKAIIAREKQGDTGTFLYVDNLSSAIAALGRELVYLIPKIYDTERVVRIMGEEGDQGSARLNVMTPQADGSVAPMIRTVDEDGQPELIPGFDLGKYDAEVKVGPTFQTRREEARESLLAFVQAIPQAGVAAGDLIAKNMDWPGADELAERLKPPDPSQAPPDPALQVAEMKAQADAQKIAADQQNGQLEAQVRMAELQVEMQRLELDKLKIAAERERMGHEMAMKNADLAPQGMALGEGGALQPAQPLQQVADMVAQLAGAVAQMSQAVAMGAQASSMPKRVVYDNQGNPIGIEPVTVQ